MAVMSWRPAGGLSRVALLCGVVLVASSCDLFRRGRREPDRPAPAPAPSRRAEQQPAEINGPRTLVRAMRNLRDGRWYETLTRVQSNVRYTTDGREHRSRWAEYVSVPGKLRIEFLPWESRSGVLYERGRVHTFDAGNRLDTRRERHAILLLTADVYVQPIDSTIAALQSVGVVTRAFHETRWRDRRVYVVGAEAGDTTSTQAWIDAERLTLVRWIERIEGGGRVTVSDTHLRSYRNVSGYPVAHEIVVHRGGRPFWRQEYQDVRANVELSPTLFDPARWRTALHPQMAANR